MIMEEEVMMDKQLHQMQLPVVGPVVH